MIGSRVIRTLAAFLTAAVLFALPLTALADAPGAERDTAVVRAFTDRIAVLQKLGTGGVGRMSALNEALDRYIDFGAAARDAMGGYWKRMEPKSHARLARGLRDHVAKRLALFLFDGTPHPIVVGEASDVVVSNNRSVVPATLRLAPGNSLQLGFLFGDSAEQPQIADVMIGGVSLMNMLAAECRAIVQNQGVDALLARLDQ